MNSALQVSGIPGCRPDGRIGGCGARLHATAPPAGRQGAESKPHARPRESSSGFRRRPAARSLESDSRADRNLGRMGFLDGLSSWADPDSSNLRCFWCTAPAWWFCQCSRVGDSGMRVFEFVLPLWLLGHTLGAKLYTRKIPPGFLRHPAAGGLGSASIILHRGDHEFVGGLRAGRFFGSGRFS